VIRRRPPKAGIEDRGRSDLEMNAKTIMVVDDSPTEQAFLEEILRRSGYEVITATSGEIGIERARADHPDLILMDVVMPGVNGFQATRAIAHDERTKHIPIIICTAKNEDTDRIWGMRQGAKAYLTKPLDESELLGKIKALMDCDQGRRLIH
jgi:twitching motility two-component system response regulator PilH